MSTTVKRSYSMLDSDDEDEPSLGRQTLPVARLSNSFNGEPMDGMQYLFTVRRDSKKLPFITHVENPFREELAKTETKQTSVQSRPRIALPSEEWRAVFLKRFRNFRKNLDQPTIGVELPFLPSSGQSKLIPEKKERDRWWDFINGRPECEWNPPKRPKKPRRESTYGYANPANDFAQYEVPITEDVAQDTTTVDQMLIFNEFGEITQDVEMGVEEPAGLLPTPFATPQPEERYKITECITKGESDGPRHPTLALLKPMDNRYCMHLLMYFTYWITQHLEHLESGQTFPSTFSQLSQNHARWMFALLSRVDEQLTSDELSSLRGLARACIAFIKDLNKNNALDSNVQVEGSSGVRWVGDPANAPLDERACWMVVAIITEFWGQRDLWMDADSALNGP